MTTLAYLDIGDTFKFDDGVGWHHTCIKTGKRSYETVEAIQKLTNNGHVTWAPLKIRVGTVNVKVTKLEADNAAP